MTQPRSEYPVYWSIWQSISRARRRRRLMAAVAILLFVALAAYGIALHAAGVAMFGAATAIVMAFLLQHGLLDGDLVALCLGLFYSRPVSRVELAIIDSQSHARAASSDIDRTIQRAVALYRSLNRGRMARVE
jgi:hypothetical protein